MSWLPWLYNYFFDGAEESAFPSDGLTLTLQVSTELEFDAQVDTYLPLDLEVTTSLPLDMHVMRG